MSYIAAIDQGTTGSTVVIVNDSLEVVAKANREFPQIFPKPGWVEHDPQSIWESVLGAFGDALSASGIDSSDLTAVGITNQRETTVLWDKDTGKPLHNAIVWQDRRTAAACEELRNDGHEDIVKRTTGLVLDPYFSGTKAKWLLNETDALERAERGQVCVGTIDTYLVWRLTGGASFVTDVTNASRTMLSDLATCDWSNDMMQLLGIPRQCLPEIKRSAEVVGETCRGLDPIPAGLPIAGIAGDQQSALFGQACFDAGMAKCTYGTGAFILMHTGEKVVRSQHGLLTTVACQTDERRQYAIEGSAFIAGAAVQWLRDGLGMIKHAGEIEALAASVESSDGVFFVPAFAGLGAPHWRPDARAVLSGLTRGSTRAHIARATLDGIAWQIADILGAMESDAVADLRELRVDGGAANNDLLMQIQADTLGVLIDRPEVIETTALGAAALAGLATNVWPSQAQLAQVRATNRKFTPKLAADERKARHDEWRQAVAKA